MPPVFDTSDPPTRSSTFGLVRERDILSRVLSRRRAATHMASILAAGYASGQEMARVTPAQAQQAVEPDRSALTPEADAFLDELERATFLYFWEQSDLQTGLVKDRCNVRAERDVGTVASIAATGFGLTALCIGSERKFVSPSEARDRVITTLRFLYSRMPTHRGFFYHWADVRTGERMWDSEISSIDTAILLCGVLTCRQHFRYREITRLATQIFNRVDWTWLSADTSLLPHGWTPELGFLQYRWDYYSELMMMYLLGIGSSTYPLACRDMARVEAQHVRIRWAAVHRLLSRRCSCISTLNRGSISAANGIAMPIISITRSSPRKFIAASAWNSRNDSPISVTTFGESPRPIQRTDTLFGAGLRRWDRSTGRWFQAPPPVPFPSFREKRYES